MLLHKLCHEYAKRIYKIAMPYIMIDAILIIISTKFLFILYSARALRTTTQYIIIIYLLMVTYINVQRNSFTDIYIKYIFNSY